MSFWDERYDQPDYLFGREPNDFLREQFHHIPRGAMLDLGTGEGRNAVFMAEQGYTVTGVDESVVGLDKATKLAAERGVELTTVRANIMNHVVVPDSWDGITSFFIHMLPEQRAKLHRAVVDGLKPGGVFILEAYTPDQLKYRTGGPMDAQLLMQAKDLERELEGLEFEILREIEREHSEGARHQGTAAMVQVLARKAD